MNLVISQNSLIQDKKNCLILDDYDVQVPLGKGAYAEVRKATHKKTGAKRAIKII